MISKRLLKIITLSCFVISFFYTLPASPALALNLDDYTQTIANQGGYQTDLGDDPNEYLNTTLGKIIAFALGFTGLVFFGLILYAGFQILTAGGNEENVKKGKSRIIHATLGLAIIVAAYIVSYTIFTVIENARLGGQPPEPQPGFECQYNGDCPVKDPPQPYCANYRTYSFCTVCLEDDDCESKNCIKTPLMHYCGD